MGQLGGDPGTHPGPMAGEHLPPGGGALAQDHHDLGGVARAGSGFLSSDFLPAALFGDKRRLDCKPRIFLQVKGPNGLDTQWFASLFSQVRVNIFGWHSRGLKFDSLKVGHGFT